MTQLGVINSFYDIPVGSVLPIMGVFSAVDNGGSYSESALNILENWQLCDGAVISDSESPFNTKNTPKLDNGIYIKGNTSAGVASGSNSVTPSTAYEASGSYTANGSVSSHSHTINHNHPQKQTTDQTGITAGMTAGTSANGPGGHSHPFDLDLLNDSSDPTTPGFTTGSSSLHSAWFISTPVNIEPLFINCNYYMRIK